MITVSSIVAPLITLLVTMIIGAGFNFLPIKPQKKKPIPLIVFAAAAGICALILATEFSAALTSIYQFQTFMEIFQGINIAIIQNNAQLVTTLVLVCVLEAGLAGGFGLAYHIGSRGDAAMPPLEQTRVTENPTPNGETVKSKTASTTVDLITQNQPAQATQDDPTLRRDEQSMMEMFLYGKVTQIVPTINPSKPEGYTYEGIPQLDWDTTHSRQVFDALVRKGYLNAELVDKIIVCQTCGSANVRTIKTCPECGSLRLHKEGLIEHFSCGAVERQTAFETQNGDLVCPKCKVKLQLIGSDYRTLPPAYKCLSCNSLNSEPKLTVKCSDCTSTLDIDDEPEIYLYKYTANQQMPLGDLKNIKPLDKVAEFYKAQGASIVAPAYVSGKSGTQHLFDMLVLGKNEEGNTAIDMLVSTKAVNLAEVTRIYGKISDIESGFLLFAIPGLTASARNYAKAYGMKVSEGKDIQEVLAKTKIPKVNGETP